MSYEELIRRAVVVAERLLEPDTRVQMFDSAVAFVEKRARDLRDGPEEAVMPERECDLSEEDELYERATRISVRDGLHWDRARGLIYERAARELAAERLAAELRTESARDLRNGEAASMPDGPERERGPVPSDAIFYLLTEAVRLADERLTLSPGTPGGSRVWVRDYLVPELQEIGLAVVDAKTVARLRHALQHLNPYPYVATEMLSERDRWARDVIERALDGRDPLCGGTCFLDPRNHPDG